MKTSQCICDEMLKRTERGENVKYREHICLSWDCSVHGKITADFRPVNHTHPPAYIPRHDPPKPKHHPDRRIVG